MSARPAVPLMVTASDAGQRLDHFLQQHLSEYSRARLQSWIKDGQVMVNGHAAKSSLILRGQETILVSPADLPPLQATPEDLPLTVLYEDEAVIAVEKASGVVVHAGAGNHTGTLVNALLHRFGQLSHLGGDLRPGIVHRLDRYTSGVLLVARHDAAHRDLAAQFASRQVEKIYLTLVQGHLPASRGKITTPITRDPVHRTRMTAKLAAGRAAYTEYEVQQTGDRYSFLRVRIGTGRTHQIRVHLASIGHPVVGDMLYGAASQPEGHYFLHAHQITFRSPATQQPVTVFSPLPPELARWKERLLPTLAPSV